MGLKIRFVCATRATQEDFFAKTALGRSLTLLARVVSVDIRLFPSNSTGLPVLYNTALREAVQDPAILIFAHDDIHICDFFWASSIVGGLQHFDILGLAGTRRRLPRQPAWLFTDTDMTRDAEYLSGVVGHGTGFPPEDITVFGPPFQEVKLLDGVMLVARSETLLSKGISFDERFDFHFYDMDFCRQAELQNLRMGTWSISVIHESAGTFGSPAWHAAYRRYLEKWGS
jgi:hypothetical protein